MLFISLITAGPLTGILWNARRIVRSPDRRTLPIPILEQFWGIVRRPLMRWMVVWVLLLSAWLSNLANRLLGAYDELDAFFGEGIRRGISVLDLSSILQVRLFEDLSVVFWAFAIVVFLLPKHENRWPLFAATMALLIPASLLPLLVHFVLQSLEVPPLVPYITIRETEFGLRSLLFALPAALFAFLAIRRARSNPERFLGIEQ